MKYAIVLTAIIFGLSLSNCKQKPKEQSNASKILSGKSYREGLSMAKQNCIACHSPIGNMDNRIAPPLIAVKEHYLEETDGEAAFVEAMSTFLLSPNIETSKMPKAIEKFGLMPITGYSKEQLEAVATYIYKTDMQKPGWFDKQHQQEKEELLSNSEEGTEIYLKKGLNLAQATKAVLGKNLLSAIQTKGTDKAVEFCNERAVAITDSMAVNLEAKIKRVSDKNRNPNNAANALELEYIKHAKLELQEEGKANPKVFEQNGKMLGYYPIISNKMCLQCHGSKETDINSKTLTVINERYPSDKATGYGANELRGIWVIEMEK